MLSDKPDTGIEAAHLYNDSPGDPKRLRDMTVLTSAARISGLGDARVASKPETAASRYG
ncbi:hypothetical protein GALLR39Z86_22570 [Glycomyces algeriensis]|uniref:Uncharacterized protein n=1 Tax=Glycomyces algeriensis TaxID=256037 RepID=A0A9W6G8U8_9ACTN|nr:hypothetical protein GALLR39Z86_22570 [Glycomyces algeriensis]